MRRKYGLFIVMAIVGLLSTSLLKAEEPQEMGKLTVSLLKSFDSWDDAFYDQHMVSVADVYLKVMNKDFESLPEERAAEADKKWRKELNRGLDEIKEQAVKENINWKKIKFVSFSYKEDMPGVEGIYKGDLVFSYKKKNYSLDVGYMVVDGKLKLGNLEDLLLEQ